MQQAGHKVTERQRIPSHLDGNKKECLTLLRHDAYAFMCLHLNVSKCKYAPWVHLWVGLRALQQCRLCLCRLFLSFLSAYETFVWLKEDIFCSSFVHMESLVITFPQITLVLTFVLTQLCALAFVPGRLSSVSCIVLLHSTLFVNYLVVNYSLCMSERPCQHIAVYSSCRIFSSQLYLEETIL